MWRRSTNPVPVPMRFIRLNASRLTGFATLNPVIQRPSRCPERDYCDYYSHAEIRSTNAVD